MSTNAPARLDRRALLTGLAALPVAGTAAAPALARPDSRLLQLGRECAELEAGIDAADKRAAEAEDRVGDHPDPPEAVFRRGSDFFVFYGFTGDSYDQTGRLWYGSMRSIAYMRTHAFTNFVGDEGAPVRDEAAHRRAAEIVAAYDAWKAEIKAMEDAAGVTAAVAESDRLFERHKVVVQEILATPATSLDELKVKAAVCVWFNNGEIEDGDLGPDEYGLQGRGVALAVVRDLLRMGGSV